MTRFLACAAVVGLLSAGLAAQGPFAGAGRTGGQGSAGGWKVPETAAAEKSPLTMSDALIAAGRRVFVDKCQRCHGVAGKGDGEDANKRYQETMNLTDATRAAENPDGVVFYKVWNGRTAPRMPTFSEELSRDQVWTVVAYVQSLRGK